MMSEKRLNERIGELADENDLLVRINKQLKKKNERLNDENEQLRQRYYALKKENDRLENNIIHWLRLNDCRKKNLKIMELSDTEHNLKMLLANSDEQTERFIKGLQDENRELRQQLQEKQEDEKLYANEILELNKTKKEMLNFRNLGSDY